MIRGERGRGREEGQQQQQQEQDDEQELQGLPPARSAPQLGDMDRPGGAGCCGCRCRPEGGTTMQEGGGDGPPALGPASRTIRFPDEAHDGGLVRTGSVGAAAFK